MDLLGCLAKTGLTGQEAALYLALCREGELTGYEGAKVAGVSRSNAYLALSSLV
jgi:sugar-specific transcriptional regulator TrmB